MGNVETAAGVGSAIHIVQSVGDAEQARMRARHDPRILATVERALTHPESAVFLWGQTGLAVLTLLHSEIDGDFAWITYLQSDPAVSLKRVVAPTFRRWADLMNVRRIAGAVDREGPWTRLTGYRPWKLVIAEEV